MPEGTEVKLLAESLDGALCNFHLDDVKILGGRFLKRPPSRMDELLLPALVSSVRSRGKLISIDLDGGWSILNTLGMTGTWSTHPTKHAHVRFRCSLRPTRQVHDRYFVDQRRFGTLRVVTRAEADIALARLGWDPLEVPQRDVEGQRDSLLLSGDARLDGVVGSVLLDQSLYAGVGNYVRAEALHRVRISPFRSYRDLTDDDAGRLHEAIRNVMRESYDLGGASFRSHVDMDGRKGDFSSRFSVYGRKVDPDGQTVVRERTPEGRTIWWVPTTQI